MMSTRLAERAPHPDLLPVKNGEKEKKPRHVSRFFALTAIAAAAVRFSTPSLE